VDFDRSGISTKVARGDHNHDATYVNEGQEDSISTPMMQNGAVTAAKINTTGLDADMLDGLHGADYATRSWVNSFTFGTQDWVGQNYVSIAQGQMNLLNVGSGGDLKMAKCGNTACSSWSLATVDSTNDVGRYSSIAIGTDGYPVISYYDASNGALKLAACNSADCTSIAPTILMIASTGNDEGKYSSIAIGIDGPNIAYYDATARDVILALCRSRDCSSSSIQRPSGNSDGYTSIAIGGGGFPMITEYKVGGLLMTKCWNPDCSIRTNNIVLNSPGGQYSSITIGIDGNPILAYYDGSALRVLKCANQMCQNNWWRR